MKSQTIKVGYLALLGLLVIASCQNATQKTSSSNATDNSAISESDLIKADFLEQGTLIAQMSGKTLVTKLQGAISREGTSGAVEFCNLEAYPITDSLSLTFNADIRRAATRYRNPQNQANGLEAEQIEKWTRDMTNGIAPTAEVVAEEDEYYYFAPILTAPFCLDCHGATGEQIDIQTASVIDRLYPNDGAKDFAAGQLRGIWSIKFN
jgi:hypothetical protein